MQIAQRAEVSESGQLTVQETPDAGEQRRQAVTGILAEVAESVVSRDPEHLPQWRQGGRRCRAHRHATESLAIPRRSARLTHLSDLPERKAVVLAVNFISEQRMRQVDRQGRLPGAGRSGDATDKLSVHADLVATDNRLVPFSIPFDGKLQPPRFRAAQYVAVLQ